MMKKFIAVILAFATMLCILCGCKPPVDETPKVVDYAAQVKLDLDSAATLKTKATVHAYIDGDTTHFNVPTSVVPTGILKARYLSVNTPESTGKIEKWGKKASNYTKNTLKSATEIILETDANEWAKDSTGERYLVWIWYKNANMTDYRCLNIELLQEGLAVGSKSSETRYGEICVSAIDQASRLQLHVHSTAKDPDFFEGKAIELDLKELRTNIEKYNGKNVAFEGIVTQYSNQGAYVEQYDENTNMYYGIYVYYGFTAAIGVSDLFTAGYHLRVVGNVNYYETGDSYQISGVDYNAWKPTDPNNLQLLDQESHPIANTLTTAEVFLSKKTVPVTVEVEGEEGETTEEMKEFPYAQLALNTSISMKNLQVIDTYTTTNEGSSSNGAMTLTCKVDGKTVTVRTMVLLDAEGKLVTEDQLMGKTIDVVGIVDCFQGEYQIKVFTYDNITIH